MKEFVVLDIGSSKIAAVVGALDDKGAIEIKGRFSGESEGIKSSLITNLSQAEESIINTLFSMEKTSKNIFRRASVSICPSSARSHYINSRVRISGSSVTKQDVQKLVHKALSDFDDSGQQVIHYFPIEFTLDNSIGITNPVGLLGKELGCNLHIISIDSGLLTNLMNCLSKCQVTVDDIVLSIYAAGLISVDLKDQNTGSLVVDFGSRSTSFGVILDEKLIYFGCVPLGSWYITSDIAKTFSISMSSAEKLKILYGSSTILENANMIHLDEIDATEFSANQVISINDLSEVINSRVEEIFTLLREEYSKLKIDDLISRNMILTGGGSQINNIAQTVGEIFSKAVTIGDRPKESSDDGLYKYTAALGMMKYTAKKLQEKFDLENNANNKSTINKMWNWFKENI